MSSIHRTEVVHNEKSASVTSRWGPLLFVLVVPVRSDRPAGLSPRPATNRFKSSIFAINAPLSCHRVDYQDDQKKS